MAAGITDRLWFVRGPNDSRGSTMRDPIERFGKTLLQGCAGGVVSVSGFAFLHSSQRPTC
jgi:hypothetical protein